MDYINDSVDGIRYVLVPHDIKKDHIEKLRSSLKNAVVYSEAKDRTDIRAQVLIVDTVGMLTSIYSYADIAYVGGGFATGLHNTLEPAVFGIPVVIGPDYHKFQEAVDLVSSKGLLVVKDRETLKEKLDHLLQDIEYRDHTGLINTTYIKHNRGATEKIFAYIQSVLDQE